MRIHIKRNREINREISNKNVTGSFVVGWVDEGLVFIILLFSFPFWVVDGFRFRYHVLIPSCKAVG